MRIRASSYMLSFLSFFIVITAVSQPIPDATIKRIDTLFEKWNAPNSPGCAIGIVRNDSLLYSKAFGMANLEYLIANTPETIFHMASVSKQFTAFAILLLERQGKLQLDDDIHSYLPWFPDLKAKITIRHLLNHTSGIRDQWQLLAISGTRIDDVITQDHIVKLLSRQRGLNFEPGEQYSYSNSGYTMLAEIVKSVSGLSLRKFTDSAIFRPLGMNNTHFHDDYTELVKNRSYSYDRMDSTRFSNSILSYSNAGATSLFTNVTDMSKWIMNFYNPRVGDQKMFEQLTKKGKLNNGKEISYALGIAVDTYKGWKQYSHGGADAGYRTNISIFPDMKMGFIVFSNLGDFEPGSKTNEIIDLFIRDTARNTRITGFIAMDSSKAVLKDTMAVRGFTGSYLSGDGAQFSFKLRDQKLYWELYGRSFLLNRAAKDTFVVVPYPEVKFVFSTITKDTVVKQYWPDNERMLFKYKVDSMQTDKQLNEYTGVYYCPELDCKYGIVLKEHHLILTNYKYNDTKLALIGKDDLLNDTWWMSHLKIKRNSQKRIIGFDIDDGRIMHLRFTKMLK